MVYIRTNTQNENIVFTYVETPKNEKWLYINVENRQNENGWFIYIENTQIEKVGKHQTPKTKWQASKTLKTKMGGS